jgi:hypothetical protein
MTLITRIHTDLQERLDHRESRRENKPGRRDVALPRLTASVDKTTSSLNEYCGPQPPSAALQDLYRLV